MYCKHCYKMMDDGLDICPYCGKSQRARIKKPIHKKWWFWAIVVFVALGVIGGGVDEAPAPQDTGDSVSQAEIDDILNSLDYEQEESPVPAIIDNSTFGEKNALRSAKSYLAYSAFSYSGLIRQLEFEGYTTEEATYASPNFAATSYAARFSHADLFTSAFEREVLRPRPNPRTSSANLENLETGISSPFNSPATAELSRTSPPVKRKSNAKNPEIAKANAPHIHLLRIIRLNF